VILRRRSRATAPADDVGNGQGDGEAERDAAGDEAVVPEAAVLDELSEVFGGDGSSRPGRRTVTIGSTDPEPEVMYLDDELARGDEAGGPVFIDDDGSDDAVSPSAAGSRRMEPRLRQRRIGVRRAASRRRLWWAAGILAVVVVIVAALAALGSQWFAVENVSVIGAVYTDADQLAAIVADLEGTPVLLVDTDDVERRVEEIAWVDSARVTTRFPDAAQIDIRERTPVVATAGSDERSRVLDVDARVLTVIDGQPVAPVWIAGPEPLDLDVAAFAPVGYAAAASLVTKLTPTIRGRVDSIYVTPDGSDLVMLLAAGPAPAAGQPPIEVRFGSPIGDSAQIEKLVRLERALADVGDDSVEVIDVSTSEVTVR
jgi:cell division protein FtsQ